MATYVIAEPGSTHEGDPALMKRLIQVAAEAGANAWKAQWVSSPARLCARRHAPEYQAAYEKIAFPEGWHAGLRKTCEAHGLDYLCTVYLPEDVPVIAPHVTRLKIASFEVRSDLFQTAVATGLPLIVSTGMLSEDEIIDLDFQDFTKESLSPSSSVMTLLHCTSSYPCPVEALNLGCLRTMFEWTPWHIGLSDHSSNTLTGALAVALGAEVIEVHHRLDETPTTNVDYAVSLSPAQLREYITHVRWAERAMGDGIKKVEPAEAAMLRYRVRA